METQIHSLTEILAGDTSALTERGRSDLSGAVLAGILALTRSLVEGPIRLWAVARMTEASVKVCHLIKLFVKVCRWEDRFYNCHK